MQLFNVLIAASVLQFSHGASTSNIAANLPTPPAPRPTSYQWDKDWVKDIPIHESCNNTEYIQLKQALEEVKLVSAHARDHALVHGNSSTIFQKYFTSAPVEDVVGVYEKLLNANKKQMLFRCDNPDGNCDIEGYAGHWRGENASDETVICELSFDSRKPLTKLCGDGYTVSGSKDSIYWAGDLLHRIFHVESFSQGLIDHFADDYSECLELAKSDPAKAAKNSLSLRLFALDAYAFDIVEPGKGCTGDDEKKKESKTSNSSASSSKPSEPTSPAASSTVETSKTPTKTTQTGKNCHTHEGGELHCI